MQAFFDRIIKPYITPQVEGVVAKSGIKEGLCLVNASHITASVFMNDAEETISLIESHEHSGRPLEDKKFIERVEALTGRKLHKLNPGQLSALQLAISMFRRKWINMHELSFRGNNEG